MAINRLGYYRTWQEKKWLQAKATEKEQLFFLEDMGTYGRRTGSYLQENLYNGWSGKRFFKKGKLRVLHVKAQSETNEWLTIFLFD